MSAKDRVPDGRFIPNVVPDDGRKPPTRFLGVGVAVPEGCSIGDLIGRRLTVDGKAVGDVERVVGRNVAEVRVLPDSHGLADGLCCPGTGKSEGVAWENFKEVGEWRRR